jgi:hypothetical protein
LWRYHAKALGPAVNDRLRAFFLQPRLDEGLHDLGQLLLGLRPELRGRLHVKPLSRAFVPRRYSLPCARSNQIIDRHPQRRRERLEAADRAALPPRLDIRHHHAGLTWETRRITRPS